MKLRKTQPKTQQGERAESSAEDTGLSGKVGSADQSLGYIMWLANAIELYQKKNCNCFGCGSPDHLVKNCTKDLGNTVRKVGLNLKEGMVKKGGQTYQNLVAALQATPDKALQA